MKSHLVFLTTLLMSGLPNLVNGQQITPFANPRVGDTVPIRLDRPLRTNESATWSIAAGRGELVESTSSSQVLFKATEAGHVVIMLLIRDPNGERPLVRRFEVLPNPAAPAGVQSNSKPPTPSSGPATSPAPSAKPKPPLPAASPAAGFVDIERLGSTIPAGWMGDAMMENDGTAAIDVGEATACRSDDQCFRVTYPKAGRVGWAAFAWQHVPEGPMNWGEYPGVDLSDKGFRSIHVWAKGEPSSGSLPRVQFKSGGNVAPKFAPTNAASYSVAGPTVLLSDTYRQFCLDLTGKNLRNVVSPLTIVLTRAANPKGAIVVVDDIQFSTAPCKE